MHRRKFLSKLGLAGLAAATGSHLKATHVWAKGPSVIWRMATAWPKKFPILQTGAERFAQLVETMSAGRMKIEVYAANEKVAPLNVHDSVSNGTIECGHTTAFYWAKKVPEARWFTSVPFGMKAQDMNTWYYEAGGRELWEQAYADYNLLPMLVGNTGIQMGGWFNYEINHPADFSGLRMRMPGLGGQVLARFGVKVVLLPAGETVQALKTSRIDAAEWVGPFHDTLMGFPDVTKYYYAPGWQEPGSTLELVVNRSAYASLPPTLRHILRSAAAKMNQRTLCAFEHHNRQALQKIITERKVKLRLFPHNVLRMLAQRSGEVLESEAAKSPMALKVHTAYRRFQHDMRQFSLLRGANIRI